MDKKDQPVIKASALDALAALASQQFSPSDETLPSSGTRACINHHDTLSMPPPPPRQLLQPKRNRSASNPEGMEKWDVYKNPSLVSKGRGGNNGRHPWMVLPSTILEEELKSAHDLCREHRHRKQLEELQGLGVSPSRRTSRPSVVPVRKIGSTDFSIYQQPEAGENISGKNALLERIVEDEVCCDDGTSVLSKTPKSSKKQLKKRSNKNVVDKTKVETRKDEDTRLMAARKNLLEFNQRVGRDELEEVEDDVEELEEEPLNELELEPEELLRRARSRLLEDLSTENGLDKGVMAFPHSLDKYKEVSESLYAWCMLSIRAISETDTFYLFLNHFLLLPLFSLSKGLQ
jgi:hypothetical protein